MATHSSILAWKIPWTEEPSRLQSTGSHRVGHNWTTNTFTIFRITRALVQFSRSVVSNSLRPHGLQHARPPCPWNFPGKNTGVGSHSFLWGILLTQGLNPGLLHCNQILLPSEPSRKPSVMLRQWQMKDEEEGKWWTSKCRQSWCTSIVPVAWLMSCLISNGLSCWIWSLASGP